MLKGEAALRRRLRRIPDAVLQAARAEMEAAARQVVQQMRMLVPVESGALRASIDWTWGAAPDGSLSLANIDGRGSLSITVYAGNAGTIVRNSRGVEFQNAALQEFGTKRMPARPYFFPAIRANRRGYTARINRAAVRAMRKIWDGP